MIRIGAVGNAALRLHPLVFAVFAVACVLGKTAAFFEAMLAVIVHELGHAVVSYAFHVRIIALELLPFGAVARLDRQGLQNDAELCIAAAGPLTSLLVAGLVAVFSGFFPETSSRTDVFLTYNVVLAAVNLLPALPLDGGRILRACLQKRFSFRAVTVGACMLGIFFGIGFLILALYCAAKEIYNMTVPTMGVFLLLAAWRELRMLPETEVQAHYRRLDALRTGQVCRVECVAVPATMQMKDAIRLLRRDRYHVLRIVDADLHGIGEVDETMLLQGIAVLGAGRQMRDLLHFSDLYRQE